MSYFFSNTIYREFSPIKKTILIQPPLSSPPLVACVAFSLAILSIAAGSSHTGAGHLSLSPSSLSPFLPTAAGSLHTSSCTRASAADGPSRPLNRSPSGQIEPEAHRLVSSGEIDRSAHIDFFPSGIKTQPLRSTSSPAESRPNLSDLLPSNEIDLEASMVQQTDDNFERHVSFLRLEGVGNGIGEIIARREKREI